VNALTIYHTVISEEMFGGPTAFWFSKDGNSIAFVKFDDSEVEFFQWPVYGEPGVRETVYPEYEPIRYPKVRISLKHPLRTDYKN
jgi:hypothetical protein